MNTRRKHGLATWAKWLIGIVIGGTILLLATCSVLFIALKSQFGDMYSPAKAREVATTIVSMKELPDSRYKYSMGLDVFGQMSMVNIEDKDKGIILSLVKLPNQHPEQTQEEVVEKLASSGIPSAGSSGSAPASQTLEIKSKGKVPVAGQDMPYVIGKTPEGTTAFLGCIIQNKTQAILVLAMKNPAMEAQLDMDSTGTEESGADKTTPETAESGGGAEKPEKTKAGSSTKKAKKTEPAKAAAVKESSDKTATPAGDEQFDIQPVKDFLAYITAFK